MAKLTADAVICGAGSAGLASAYYLSQMGLTDTILIDQHEPLSQTSAKSGENYRTWWPNESMVAFNSRSIELLDDIVAKTNNQINLDRRGYLYISEQKSLNILDVYQDLDLGGIRIHEKVDATYQPFHEDFSLQGADVLVGDALIKEHFPHLSNRISFAIHARRAGSLSAQQLGMYHLNQAKARGLRLLKAEVVDLKIDDEGICGVLVNQSGESIELATRVFINAAGPFIGRIAAMFGETLAIKNIFQQKIAFRDYEAILPRQMPFTVFLDEQMLNWNQEEKDLLAEEPELAWFLSRFQGGLHIKPEGGRGSILVKLGWAFNRESEEPQWDRRSLASFPDVVIRGASRFIPRLERYIAKLPKPILHYGGYYTKTEENLPLIGAMKTRGAYVIGALSGFGTMACCAAGELLAKQILNLPLPSYAEAMAPSRYDDVKRLEHLRTTAFIGEL